MRKKTTKKEKQQTIQTALDQLNDLSIKTNTEYDKLQENKSVKRFELEQAEIKLSLLRKYSGRTTYSSVAGWTKAPEKSHQPVVQQVTSGPRTNNFIIDVKPS